MARNGPDKRRQKRILTKEEQELWRQISQQIVPLKSKFCHSNTACDHQTPKQSTGSHKIQLGKTAHAQRVVVTKPARIVPKPKPQPQNSKPPTNSKVKVQQIADFDAKLARKIGKGQIRIDARLDLHGMRQSEAKSALKNFLLTSMSRRYRVVLIITGKGEPDRSHTPWDGGIRANRGVLKRLVPYWLHEPELSFAIVSYMQAHVHHGGNGALYVQIKRSKHN